MTLPMESITPMPQADTPTEKPRVNCLSEIFRELLDERKVSLAEVQRATGIPWGTIHAWYIEDVKAQIADQNLLKLAQYFRVDLAYLLYGIGTGESQVFPKEKKEDCA